MVPWPRLEVRSMWFENKNNNNNKDPAHDHFKGRIFMADTFVLHEIYNSGYLDSLYAVKKKPKRKWLDSRSGRSDLPGTNDESSVGPQKTYLPVMGPNKSGMLVMPQFSVLVHQDSGNPIIEEAYEEQATSSFFGSQWLLSDEDKFRCCVIGDRRYNEPFLLTVDCAFGLLTLDCIVITGSKSVFLMVEWQEPNENATDIYIGGSLTVTNNIIKDVESVLLQTPPDKAVKLSPGDIIPLLKSVVVVPLHSSFTVNAQLQYSGNAYSASYDSFSPIVENGAATFPVVVDDKDASEAPNFSDYRNDLHCSFYKSTKHIDCIDGSQLKVTAYVSNH